MTQQEAIEIITNAIQTENMTAEQDKVLAIVQKATDKQIPKKPIDICTPVVTWGLCPVCKGELSKLGGRPNRVFKGNAYCPDCGQALDWGIKIKPETKSYCMREKCSYRHRISNNKGYCPFAKCPFGQSENYIKNPTTRQIIENAKKQGLIP